jgi:CheY-like chemotaxis protein
MPGRILIVEDDTTHRYAISRLLEKDGFSGSSSAPTIT